MAVRIDGRAQVDAILREDNHMLSRLRGVVRRVGAVAPGIMSAGIAWAMGGVEKGEVDAGFALSITAAGIAYIAADKIFERVICGLQQAQIRQTLDIANRLRIVDARLAYEYMLRGLLEFPDVGHDDENLRRMVEIQRAAREVEALGPPEQVPQVVEAPREQPLIRKLFSPRVRMPR